MVRCCRRGCGLCADLESTLSQLMTTSGGILRESPAEGKFAEDGAARLEVQIHFQHCS